MDTSTGLNYVGVPSAFASFFSLSSSISRCRLSHSVKMKSACILTSQRQAGMSEGQIISKCGPVLVVHIDTTMRPSGMKGQAVRLS